MAIVQKNLYTPGQNLNNQAENIDLNRVADDKSFITVNFGTSPATVTIKAGSLIEVNGNQYAIETADEVFQMSSSAHHFIGFDGVSFSSYASIGTYSPIKQGYYQADNITRTIRWFIDQNNSHYGMSQAKFSYGIITSNLTISAGTIIPFVTPYYDLAGEYNTSTGYMTAIRDGFYFFHVLINIRASASGPDSNAYLLLNGTTKIATCSRYNIGTSDYQSMEMTGEVFLTAGDTVSVWSGTTGTGIVWINDIVHRSKFMGHEISPLYGWN